jgi:hypothetical protein
MAFDPPGKDDDPVVVVLAEPGARSARPLPSIPRPTHPAGEVVAAVLRSRAATAFIWSSEGEGCTSWARARAATAAGNIALMSPAYADPSRGMRQDVTVVLGPDPDMVTSTGTDTPVPSITVPPDRYNSWQSTHT